MKAMSSVDPSGRGGEWQGSSLLQEFFFALVPSRGRFGETKSVQLPPSLLTPFVVTWRLL